MEVKVEIYRRLPPGDRWVAITSPDDRVHPSLTDALEEYFQQHGTRQYYIDAVAGYIYKVENAPDPKPIIKQFSIYGDY